VAGTGSDAPNRKDGDGGSDSTSIADANGEPGTGGLGGGATGVGVGWEDSSVIWTDWLYGAGGASGNDGGGGGGYGGGGRGNKISNHYSGGGGGGSWALQDSASPNSTYQVGQDGYDEPGVILTFETSPDAAQRPR
jgi:hypothetical protein